MKCIKAIEARIRSIQNLLNKGFKEQLTNELKVCLWEINNDEETQAAVKIFSIHKKLIEMSYSCSVDFLKNAQKNLQYEVTIRNKDLLIEETANGSSLLQAFSIALDMAKIPENED